MPGARLCLLWALSVCATAPALATKLDVVRFETNMSCVQYHHSESLKQASLYGEAYAWTRHAALADWHFEAVAVSSSGLLDNPLGIYIYIYMHI